MNSETIKKLDSELYKRVRLFHELVYKKNQPIDKALDSLILFLNTLPLSRFSLWKTRMCPWCTAEPMYGWNICRDPDAALGSVTLLDIFSHNGYRREEALHNINTAVPNSFLFSQLLTMLNDWVPQVRLAACQAIKRVMHITSPAIMTESLCEILYRWTSWQRMEKQEHLVIEALLSLPKLAEPMRQKIIRSSSGPIPSLLAQIGRTSLLDCSLFEVATTAIQPSVRAKAYRFLFEKRMFWISGREHKWVHRGLSEQHARVDTQERHIEVEFSFETLLEQASKDKSSKVRRVAIEYLIKNDTLMKDKIKHYALIFAQDKAHTVSERGQFLLRKLSGDTTF